MYGTSSGSEVSPVRVTVNDPVSPASVSRASVGRIWTPGGSDAGKIRNESSWFCAAVAARAPAETSASPRSVSMCVTDFALAIGSFSVIEKLFGVPLRFQTRAITPCARPCTAHAASQVIAAISSTPFVWRTIAMCGMSSGAP